jgi:hypothetical protein
VCGVDTGLESLQQLSPVGLGSGPSAKFSTASWNAAADMPSSEQAEAASAHVSSLARSIGSACATVAAAVSASQAGSTSGISHHEDSCGSSTGTTRSRSRADAADEAEEAQAEFFGSDGETEADDSDAVPDVMDGAHKHDHDSDAAVVSDCWIRTVFDSKSQFPQGVPERVQAGLSFLIRSHKPDTHSMPLFWGPAAL